MDLRSMLNDGSGPGAAASASAALTPGKQPQPPMPSTPVQTVPPHSFRDYSQSAQASPGRAVSRDHRPPQTTPFRSPPPYHPQATPYDMRPVPPPLQPISGADVRSPGGPGSIANPSPSYRQTPTSSVSAAGGGGGYPFPPTQPVAGSPVQQHRYPPGGVYPPRDSFSQPPGPGGVTGPPGASSYMQGPPMTPPVGTPGSAHPYLHQRSQSSHSTPTPTSAQSQQQQQQHPYGQPYASPVAAARSLPPDHVRQASQPPTPLGPPRAPSGTGSFAHPPSPYQQRISSAGGYPYGPQASPHPPAPPSLIRIPTSQSLHDAHPSPADAHRRSTSRSERERSISVSPKTRVPSLPSSGGHPSISGPVPDRAPSNSLSAMETSDWDYERAVTPAKRKMDDRDLKPEEIERQEPRPPPFGVNGSHVPALLSARSSASRSSVSPLVQRGKRVRRLQPPVWAQTFDGRQPLHAPNYVLRKAHQVGQAQVNGKPSPPRPEKMMSRHPSPETMRGLQVAPPQPAQAQTQPSAPAAPAPGPRAAPVAETKSMPMGPWEPSITGTKPLDEICKQVADWLYINVVRNQEIGDVSDPDVKFEIEAKLGMLISKDTNDRVRLPVASECLLVDTGRVGFRSTMTEAQHKAFNDFLNAMVVEADPRNPKNASNPRVPIKYLHRREVDKFYELPASRRADLPAAVQNIMPPKHTVKVRVSTDQKTGQQLAKIVKVRVADMSLYLPAHELDCRISVNLEVDWHGPVEELERLAKQSGLEGRLPDRNKDRLSYDHGHYQVDLTQVTQLVPGPANTFRPEKEHELEIEVSADTLIQQGRLAEAGEPSNYKELVEGFVDNVRVLARKARELVR